MMKSRGFTLIELMIAVTIVGVLLTLAAPSMYDFILTQRLRSINAQLVTDMQYARSEAATKNRNTYVRFTELAGSMSCYVIYVGTVSGCDCMDSPVCDVAKSGMELRTVVVPNSSKVVVSQANAGNWTLIGYDPKNGALLVPTADVPIVAPEPFKISVSIDSARALRTVITPAGRPNVCAPTGSKVSAPACPSASPP